MSDERLKRRRFLADVLFAGSAVAGAGLLSRWAVAQKPPETPKTPSPTPSPSVRGEPQVRPKGDYACPPSSSPTPTQPPTGGKPVAPR